MSLVNEAQVDAFISEIKASYSPYRDLEGEALKEVVFATKPSSGVCGTSIRRSVSFPPAGFNSLCCSIQVCGMTASNPPMMPSCYQVSDKYLNREIVSFGTAES